ncbi:MAG: peptidyl-prolyl cis-trans isomerase, partial [Fibromonadaceae bacterium]|nr:peptidyl-prolyl cis-trans isomerase [Fibromonadaceae bacterium]
MRYSLLFISALLALTGCGTAPTTDKTIAKIGNTSLYASDAEFLSAIRPADHRDQKAVQQDLQQVAETRRLAEVARRMFAGEQNAIQEKLASEEKARLAQVYVYFYLQTNMGQSNKAILDFYKKNKARYPDSTDIMHFFKLREKIAEDLFLERNPEVAAQVNDTNRTMILDSCRRAIPANEIDKLRTLYKVEIVKIEPPNVEEYYKANPDMFLTKTQYKLLGLSDSDSSALAQKMKGITTREEFAKVAKDMPLIKQGHAIRDIGMFPVLDTEVPQVGAKNFTRILRAPDTQLFYVFYVESIIEPQLKPFDRARNLVRAVLESQGDIPLDPSTILVTINGKPLITEEDVLELKSKIHPQRQMGFRRDDAVKSLMEENLYARAGKEKNIDKTAEYVAWNRQLIDRAYVQVLMDSLINQTLGVPIEALKAAYEEERETLFAPMSFEESKMDVAVWLLIPDIAYKREFVLNGQNYGGADSWEGIKRAAYKNIRYREYRGVHEKVMANLLKDIPVTIVDASWDLEFTPKDFAGIAARAVNHYENKNLQGARALWETARHLFPQDDSIQRAVSYELANLFQELGLYNDAV